MVQDGMSEGSGAPGGGARGRSLRRTTARAQEYLREPQKLVRLLEDAARKSDADDGPGEEVKALVRLVFAYTRGEYRQIPRDKLVGAVAAIVYFVSPIDIIPDFLGFIGLSDDALVLAFVTRMAREEIDRFLTWELEHANPPAAEVIDVVANG